MSRGVWKRLREERSESVLEIWRLAPARSRLFAAAVLAGGIGLGALAGGAGTSSVDGALLAESEPTLAETYWIALVDDRTDVNGEGEE